MKVVYNNCYGGFSLSNRAVEMYEKLKGLLPNTVGQGREIKRNDPVLIKVVEQLKRAADGAAASLAIKDVPAGVKYKIDEYDGAETVITIDQYEWEIATED